MSTVWVHNSRSGCFQIVREPVALNKLLQGKETFVQLEDGRLFILADGEKWQWVMGPLDIPGELDFRRKDFLQTEVNCVFGQTAEGAKVGADTYGSIVG